MLPRISVLHCITLLIHGAASLRSLSITPQTSVLSNSSGTDSTLGNTTLQEDTQLSALPLIFSRKMNKRSARSMYTSLLNTNATVSVNVTAAQHTNRTEGMPLVATDSKAASAAGLGAVFGMSSATHTSVTNTSTDAIDQTSVSNATYQTALRYAKFSAAAYAQGCSNPDGATLITTFGSAVQGSASSALGYVARDDANKEFVIAFQGDPSLQSLPSAATASQGTSLVAALPGFNAPTGALVNTDLQQSAANFSIGLEQAMSTQLQAHSDYSITFTGHGTGGSLASMTAVSFVAAYGNGTAPDMQVVTFGAPRIGNQIWANYTESLFISSQSVKYLRVTHSTDNIPQVLTTANGYEHSSVELFQKSDTLGAQGMLQCSGPEDVKCNDATATTTNVTQLAQASDNTVSTDSVSTGSNTNVTASTIGTSASTVDTTGSQAAAQVDQAANNTQSLVLCSTCTGENCIGCVDDTGAAVQGLQSTSPDSTLSTQSTAQVNPVTGLPYGTVIDPSTSSTQIDPATGLPYGTARDPSTSDAQSTSGNAIDPVTGALYSSESAAQIAQDVGISQSTTNSQIDPITGVLYSSESAALAAQDASLAQSSSTSIAAGQSTLIDPITGALYSSESAALAAKDASLAQSASTSTGQSTLIDPITGALYSSESAALAAKDASLAQSASTSATQSTLTDPITGVLYSSESAALAAKDASLAQSASTAATQSTLTDPITGVLYSSESAATAAKDFLRAQSESNPTGLLSSLFGNTVNTTASGIKSIADTVNTTASAIKSIADKTVTLGNKVNTTSSAIKSMVDKTVAHKKRAQSVTDAAGMVYLGINMIADASQFCSATSSSSSSSTAAAADTGSTTATDTTAAEAAVAQTAQGTTKKSVSAASLTSSSTSMRRVTIEGMVCATVVVLIMTRWIVVN